MGPRATEPEGSGSGSGAGGSGAGSATGGSGAGTTAGGSSAGGSSNTGGGASAGGVATGGSSSVGGFAGMSAGGSSVAGGTGGDGGSGAVGAGGSGSVGGSAGAASGGAGGQSGSAGSGSGGCGDGQIGGAEQCDDSNTSSGDGCSSTCFYETDCDMDNPRPTIICGQTLSGNMGGNWGDVQDICGKSFLYQDQLYIYTPGVTGEVTVTHTGNRDDMAIFVMEGSCHAGLCIGDSTTSGDPKSITFTARAGVIYYIDLEAPSAQPSYTITLTCN